jgi:hypothetical protein
MKKKKIRTTRRRKRISNLPIRARLMSITELMKLTKTQLINKITQSIAVLSKKKLAVMYYQIQKAKLPILPLKKRKFSAKQLAAQRLFAKRARAGTLRRRKR